MKKVLLGLVILFSMSASAMTIGSDEINTVALDSISVDANAIMTAMSDANVNSAIYCSLVGRNSKSWYLRQFNW